MKTPENYVDFERSEKSYFLPLLRSAVIPSGSEEPLSYPPAKRCHSEGKRGTFIIPSCEALSFRVEARNLYHNPPTNLCHSELSEEPLSFEQREES